jgi:hypothetical protein
MQTLTNADLTRIAPSIFASNAAPHLSTRYSLIPTANVLDALRGEGWGVVKAAECRVRKPGAREFTKHMLRLRRVDGAAPMVGDSFPEVVLINSHDGSSGYQLHAGLFRLVCSNGLVVDNGTFDRISVRHTGRSADEVVEASFKVLDQVPALAASVDGMRSLQLTAGEQTAFATAALVAKYGDEKAPVEADQILRARRYEDRDGSLWSTFNRVQENLINGGVRGRSAETRRRITTREVTGIDKNVGLNKALWTLAEEMRKIKVAG